MFDVKHLGLTELEAKALWLRAELGSHVPCPEIDRDTELQQASESAIGKLYRAYRQTPWPAKERATP